MNLAERCRGSKLRKINPEALEERWMKMSDGGMGDKRAMKRIKADAAGKLELRSLLPQS